VQANTAKKSNFTYMKNLLTTTLLAFSQFIFSQVVKNPGDFSSIKVYDALNVELIQSKENKIEISGKRASEVEVVNKNGELKIRMSFSKLLKGEDTAVKVYLVNIDQIDANEGSFVSSSETFEQTDMAISAKEGAEINLKINVQSTKIRAVTGGIINVSGKASVQELNVGTGGQVDAKDLKTTQTTVTITTGGEASIFATKLVEAKTRAGGTILIYGKPSKINEKTILGGTIKQMD
jgi:hypothetical protein